MIREVDLPDAGQRLDLAARASDRLRDAAFRTIGIDNFVRPADPMAKAAEAGTLQRNLQGYTCDEAEVPIGLEASAISSLPAGHAQNTPRTSDSRARMGQSRLGTTRGHALFDEDRLRGRVIERLLCDFAVDPAAFADPDAARGLTWTVASAWPGRSCSTERDARARDRARNTSHG
ncbi:hypothetical protein [uncultured Jannaschia sp.]|uniref:hypothetical protein n=1 Tax=uncultured Jannaschia sp. TaxID=293347 RepID=UPI00260161AF|nr:hypothetical protein [uncultured Jannaschia sp.]